MVRWFSIAVFLAASAASAAEPEPAPVVLPPVDVPLPPEEAQPTSSSPSRRDPSGSVTVVEAKDHQGEAKDTASLLAPAPGVVVASTGSAGQAQTVSVRGAASNGVLVLLDGIPLGGPGESVDLATVPAAVVERLEVLRGGGARYGPGALGGVVNIVTQKPRSGARLFADGTQGAFTTTQLSVGASGQLPFGEGLLVLHGLRTEGDFTYRYRPLGELQNSAIEERVRKNNQALMGGGLLRWRAELSRGVALDALLESTVLGRGLAGTVANPTSDAAEQAVRVVGSARVSKTFEAGGRFEAFAWGRTLRNTFAGSGFFAEARTQAANGAGAEATYTDLWFGRHGVTALVSGSAEWLNVPGMSRAPTWGRFSVMAQDEVLLLDGDLTVNASVRVDQSGPFTGVSPKLGALWLLPKGFEVKANVGQAHRPPSFFELYVLQGHLLPNPDLRPERSLYVDGAAAFRHEKGFVSVGGFYAMYEDLISYEYYPPMLARPYNFAAARVTGVEVEAKFAPVSWLSASASYTLLYTQNLKDDPRYYLLSLPYRPRHKVHGRLAVGPKWLYARGEVLYQSSQFMNRTETTALQERALVNVGATCELLQAPKLALSFELKNVLDVSTMDLDGYPLPPRAAYVTLGLTWDVI